MSYQTDPYTYHNNILTGSQTAPSFRDAVVLHKVTDTDLKIGSTGLITLEKIVGKISGDFYVADVPCSNKCAPAPFSAKTSSGFRSGQSLKDKQPQPMHPSI